MIFLIKYKADWELIRQIKQMQMNKDNIHKDNDRFYHDYKVGDKSMLTDNAAYKNQTPYKGTFFDNTVLDRWHIYIAVWYDKVGII